MAQLGDEVKDSVSGFVGVAVAKYSYLNGCDRISVQPMVNGEGKLPDTATFDDPQLEVLTPGKVRRGPINTGGPEKYTPSPRPIG